MTEQQDNTGTATLFVYGTLQRGSWNHAPYCSEAISIEPATVRGRLYELGSGIPVLEVPAKDIVGVGSSDILGDLAMQRRLEAESVRHPKCDGEDWQWIEGELIVLPRPEVTVPPVDRLEGFRPRGVCFYRRVLVPVILTADASVTTAWCYVAGPGVAGMLRPTGLTRWGQACLG